MHIITQKTKQIVTTEVGGNVGLKEQRQEVKGKRQGVK